MTNEGSINLVPRGPLNVYHPNAPLKHIMVPAPDPPGQELADPLWVALARDIAGALYVEVERARHTAPSQSQSKAIQYQLVAATTAIAATETESLSALSALGLYPSAQVHARAIGICARNVVVFSKDANLAAECYNSLEASRKDFMRQSREELSDVPGLLEKFEQRFADAVGKSMRELEQKQAAQFRVYREYLMSAYFQSAWSKWAHADIVALADAGDWLARPTDVRSALILNRTGVDGMLTMATSFALVPYAVLGSMLGTGSDDFNRFVQRHDELLQKNPIREEVQAMFDAFGISREQ